MSFTMIRAFAFLFMIIGYLTIIQTKNFIDHHFQNIIYAQLNLYSSFFLVMFAKAIIKDN
jgi:hypothetical protein